MPDFYVILYRHASFYSSIGYTVTATVGKKKLTFLYFQGTRICTAIVYILVQKELKKDRKSISGNVFEDDAMPGNRSSGLFPRNSNVSRVAVAFEPLLSPPSIHRAYRNVSNFMGCGKKVR
jgi:hypothetical protein